MHIDADEAHITMIGGKKAIVPLISIYEGVERESKRGKCKNIFHISEYGLSAEELWEKASEEIYSKYDLSQAKIYLHGDGGAWIQRGIESFRDTQFVLSGNYTLYIERDKLSTAKGTIKLPKSSEKSINVTIEIGQSWNFVAWPGNNKLDNWKYDEAKDTVLISDDWGGALIPGADSIKNFKASVTFGPIKNEGGQVGFEFCSAGSTDVKSSVFVSVAKLDSKYVLRINQYQHNTLITLKSNIVIDNNNPCELILQRVDGIYTILLNGKKIAVLDEDKVYNAQGSEILPGYLDFGKSKSVCLKDLITSNHNQLRFCVPMVGEVTLFDWRFEEL